MAMNLRESLSGMTLTVVNRNNCLIFVSLRKKLLELSDLTRSTQISISTRARSRYTFCEILYEMKETLKPGLTHRLSFTVGDNKNCARAIPGGTKLCRNAQGICDRFYGWIAGVGMP